MENGTDSPVAEMWIDTPVFFFCFFFFVLSIEVCAMYSLIS